MRMTILAIALSLMAGNALAQNQSSPSLRHMMEMFKMKVEPIADCSPGWKKCSCPGTTGAFKCCSPSQQCGCQGNPGSPVCG